MSDWDKLKCKKCGQTATLLILLAMGCEAGMKCSPSPDRCDDGEKHIFESEKDNKEVVR